MPYTGPTLITYEEWWQWERKRLKAGKAPSKRSVEYRCNYCQLPTQFQGPNHYCKKMSGLLIHDLFTLCERVKMSY